MDKFYSARQAAHLLGVNVKTAERRGRKAVEAGNPNVMWMSATYFATEVVWRQLFLEEPVDDDRRPFKWRRPHPDAT